MDVEAYEWPTHVACEALGNANEAIDRALKQLKEGHAESPAALSTQASRHAKVRITNLDAYPSDQALLNLAFQLVRERSERQKFFPEYAFGEPVWDILLDLYIAGYTGKRISVSSACIAANVPPTTALRYVTMMTEEQLIERAPDLQDARKIYLSLSDMMKQSMRNYLVHTHLERG